MREWTRVGSNKLVRAGGGRRSLRWVSRPARLRGDLEERGGLARFGPHRRRDTAELWDQRRRLGVALPLPRPEPVAISSIGKARARVHEDVFRELHREILARDTRGPDWNGHRTFAVDGSKINLPRPLPSAWGILT